MTELFVEQPMASPWSAKYKKLYVIKLSNWSFSDIQTHTQTKWNCNLQTQTNKTQVNWRKKYKSSEKGFGQKQSPPQELKVGGAWSRPGQPSLVWLFLLLQALAGFKGASERKFSLTSEPDPDHLLEFLNKDNILLYPVKVSSCSSCTYFSGTSICPS